MISQGEITSRADLPRHLGVQRSVSPMSYGYMCLHRKLWSFLQTCVAQWLARFVRDPEVNITVSNSEYRRGVAQWLARFVRDPEVNITVSNSEYRRGVAQWLARFVRDEEAGGSSPLTPTTILLDCVV